MTQDEIIRMAREAGITQKRNELGLEEKLIVFAMTAMARAVLAEREACAKVCEKEAASWARLNAQDEEGYGAIQCAVAIRARGEK